MADWTEDDFSSQFAALARAFTVPDLLTEVSVAVFVLESPHVQELRFGAPVAGPSGATMTKHVFGDKFARLPLGRIVKKNQDEELRRPSLDRIGIMNVCPIPMQRAAYGDARLAKDHSALFDALEGVRQNNAQSNYAMAEWREAQAWIRDDFSRRLGRLSERSCLIVPCGRFAQKFFRLAGLSDANWTVLDGVPHPSYNSWDRLEYRTVIDRLKAELQKREIGLSPSSAEIVERS